MQIIFDSQQKSIVRMEKGDDCLYLLQSIAEKRKRSFSFSMIGACSFVEVGCYAPKKQKYVTKEFRSEHFEILSLIGNVGWFEGKPVVHTHGIFSDKTYKTFGGHIIKLIISATGECVINWLPKKLNKRYDEITGLKLLSNFELRNSFSSYIFLPPVPTRTPSKNIRLRRVS